jgi:hypothetical protein
MNGKDLLAYYQKNGRPYLNIGISSDARAKKVIGIRRIEKIYKDVYDMVMADLDEHELAYVVECPTRYITIDVSNTPALKSNAQLYADLMGNVSLGVQDMVCVKYIWMVLAHEFAHILAYPGAQERLYACTIDHDTAPSERWADTIARQVTGVNRSQLYWAFLIHGYNKQ